MALQSKVTYIGDGTTDIFAITFPFIARTHVTVEVNKTVILASRIEFLTDSSMRLRDIPGANDSIEIFRETPIDVSLVDFQNGAVLTEAELDLAKKQNFFLVQETNDKFDEHLDAAVVTIGTTIGAVTTVPDQVIDNIVTQLLLDEAASTIQARIADIDTLNEVQINEITRFDNMRTELDLTGVISGDGLAWIMDLDRLKVSSTETFGSRLTSINAEVDLRATTFRQATIPPEPLNIGDLWIDSSDNEELHRWNGTAWVDVHDIRITTNASDITAVTTRVTTAEGDIVTVDGRVDLNVTSITTAEGDIVSLEAKFGVTLDVNGYISGFSLNSTTTESEFIIVADKFKVIEPGVTVDADAVAVFSIAAGVVTINNLKVVDADIENLTVGKLTTGTLGVNFVMNGSMDVGGTGNVRGGQTTYDDGTAGFYLGDDAGTPKFSIGDGLANNLTWDGTKLTISGDIGLPNYTAGEGLLLSATTTRTSPAGSFIYTTVKEYTIGRAGSIRVKGSYSNTGAVTTSIQTTPRYRILQGSTVLFESTDFDFLGEVRSNVDDDVTITLNGGNVKVQLRTGEGQEIVGGEPQDRESIMKVQSATIHAIQPGNDAVVTD